MLNLRRFSMNVLSARYWVLVAFDVGGTIMRIAFSNEGLHLESLKKHEDKEEILLKTLEASLQKMKETLMCLFHNSFSHSIRIQ